MDNNETQKEDVDVEPVATSEEKKETVVEAVTAKIEEVLKDVKEEPVKTIKQTIKDNWKILLPLAVIAVVALGAWWGRSLFVAAIVDGEPISRFAVIKELEKRSGGQALDTMVIKKIILKRALENNISISNDDVEKEIATLEERMSTQGGTLEDALLQQGMTMEQFREQIILQKALEKILADKVAVTDEEVAAYLTETKATTPTAMTDDEFKERVREQIKGQKFGVEVEKWLIEEKQKANIQYFVDYALPLPGEEVTEEPVEETNMEMEEAPASSQQ
jgi:foldase protein PrsA